MKNLQQPAQILALLLMCCTNRNAQAQLAVSSSTNYAVLVDSFIHSGVSVSNINYKGNALSCGYFSNGNTTNLGARSGIVLSTGYVADIGNGVSSTGSGDMGVSGDSLLTALTGGNTYDAAVLEFDLVPTYDTLAFRFIYGSEDYPEWVGGSSQYQDYAAVFVSGSNPSGGNYTKRNFAIIPNTNLPVVVNNINDSVNAQFFVKNTAGSVIFDGFTKVMEVKIPVVPAASYHLVFGIADGGDKNSDGGLLLLSQSLISYNNTSTISEPGAQKNFHLFPNPAKDRVICSSKDAGTLTITNELGQSVLTADIGVGQTPIETAQLPQGIYFVVMQTDKQTLRQKLVVQR